MQSKFLAKKFFLKNVCNLLITKIILIRRYFEIKKDSGKIVRLL